MAMRWFVLQYQLETVLEKAPDQLKHVPEH